MLALRVVMSLAVTRYINSVLRFPQQHNVKARTNIWPKVLNGHIPHLRTEHHCQILCRIKSQKSSARSNLIIVIVNESCWTAIRLQVLAAIQSATQI